MISIEVGNPEPEWDYVAIVCLILFAISCVISVGNAYYTGLLVIRGN